MGTLILATPKGSPWALLALLCVGGGVAYVCLRSTLGRRCACGHRLSKVASHAPDGLADRLRAFTDRYNLPTPLLDNTLGCPKCHRLYEASWHATDARCQKRHEFTQTPMQACKNCGEPAYQLDVGSYWENASWLADAMAKYPVLAERLDKDSGRIPILRQLGKVDTLNYTDRLYLCRACLTLMCWMDVPDTNTQFCVAFADDDALRRAIASVETGT